MVIRIPRIGCFLLFFLLLSGHWTFSQWCAPPGTTLYTTGCTANDFVNSFATTGGITNISNLNTGCNGGTSGFTLFNQTHTAQPGDVVNYTVAITPATFPWAQGVKIWVDWNQNGSFLDPGEEVYASATTLVSGSSVSGSFTVPVTAAIGVTRMRVRCVFATTSFTPCSQQTYGEVEDYNFEVLSLTPCAGTPNVSATATATTVCPNAAFTLQTLGALGTGYAFQWQSSPLCANSFTNIPGATTANYPVTAGIAASTDYRVIVTCTNSGGIDTSNILPLTVACYCTSTATAGTGADIGRIRIGNASYNYAYPTAPPSQLINNGLANGTYSNLTGTAPIITLTPGVNYGDTVTQINSTANNGQAYFRAFIDYNRDGDFTDPGENIANVGGNTIPSQNTYVFNFTVPLTASFGLTRMRKVLVANGNIATVNACGNYAEGETEDYAVLIMPSQPTASSNSPICSNQPLNLSVTPTVLCATYNWTGPSFTSTQQNPTIAAPLPGTYSVTYTYNGITYGPATVNVSVGASTTALSLVSLCAGNTFTTPNNQVLSAAGTYPETYTNVAGCDSIINYVVSILPGPAAPTVTSPVNYCQSATAVALSATGANLKWYTTPTGGTGSATPPVPSTATLGVTTYYVSQTVSGCEGPRAAIQVIVNPIPNIGTATGVNPTSCGGANGSITLSGLVSGTSYTVSYSLNGVPQPNTVILGNASGNVVINNLAAGAYSNISVSALGCVSSAVGPVTLSNPPLPVIGATSATNPTTCAGTTGSISLSGLTPGTSYIINFTRNGVPQAAQTLTANAIGTVVIPGLNAANYTNITVTLNGCVSLPAGPIVLSDPAGPVVASVTNNGPLCTGQTLNLTATTIPGAFYSWSGPITSSQQNPSVAAVTLANAGTYTVTATLNGCSSAPVSTTVIVNQTPPTPQITANTPFCSGDTAAFSATSFPGGVYTWTGPTFTSNVQNPVINGISAANSGVYSLTITANGCSSQAGTLNVVVNPTPPAPAVTNLTYCQFQPASPLTAVSAPGATLAWYAVPTGGSPLATAPTPPTASAGVATWYVAQSALGCTSSRSPITVTVTSKPPVPGVTTPLLFCQNESVGPLTAVGTSLQWYAAATGGTPLPGAPTPNTASAGTTNYYVSQTISGCESDRSAIAVTVAPTPGAPVVASPVVYCQFETGLPSLTTYVTGTALQWYSQAIGGAPLATPPVITTNTPDTVTYYVSQSVGACESPRAALQVQIRVKPQPPITDTVYLCQYEAASPLTAIGQGLLWYFAPSGGPAGSPQAPSPATVSPGVFLFYVSQTVNTCESDRAPLVVVVKPRPAQPVAITAYTYCQFDTVVAPLSATGLSIKWYTAPVGGSGSNIAPIPATNLPGVYNWYVTQTVDGCESDRLTITVEVLPKPAPPIVASPLLLCEDDTAAPLTAQGQGLKWYVDSVGFQIYTGSPVPFTDTVGTQYYWVSQTVNGCESDRAMLVVQINPRVYASILVSENPFCQYDTIDIKNNITNNPATASYQWNFGGGVPLSGAGAGPFSVTYDTAGTTAVTVLVTNLNCTATDTKVLTVKPSPDAYFEIKPDVCKGEIVKVQASFEDLTDDAFYWEFDNAQVLLGSGPGYYKLRWDVPGQKVVMLKTEKAACLSKPFYDTLIVHEDPAASIVYKSTSEICAADTVYFRAADLGSDYTYTWAPERFFDLNGQRELYAKVQKTGYVTLTVTDPYGCIGRDSSLVNTYSCCQATLPSAFTPNGDGRNDLFRIISPGNFALSSFRVVNRWGQTIFETLNQNEGWDGTFMGKPQPTGSYFYFLRLKCSDENIVEQKGELMLVR